ncbi:hypothetical protein FM076_09840 [Streptomyces albus subsp. chlorinus]|uniref:peptidoglycan-binding domain-containing protein n=1 Tax=Streptomyces albus TaxID=1888 RepID=UPI0015701660|nr:peptidoglycan-binding domain-containing protein [Streptomyces albus]NSC21490.1 hypothetical protein [Streptomyces albus subsp. chlorinus]
MRGDERCPACGNGAEGCAHGTGTAAPEGTRAAPDSAPGGQDGTPDRPSGRPHGTGERPDGTGEPQGAGGGARTEDPEDPLHIRPYVRLHEASSPAPASEESAAGAGADGHGDAHVPLPDLSPFAAQGTDETAELPAVVSRGGGARPRARRRRAAAPAAPAAHRREEERRRPSTAVFAGVGVAAVLGAGLLTTQILTDHGSGTPDGRALRQLPTGAPTHALPTASPSRQGAPERTERPAPLPSRTGVTGEPRADRGGGEHTASPSPSRGTGDSAERPDGSGSGEGERRHGRPHPVEPDRSPGRTLRPGDTGPEVAELQRRLKQAGFYDRDAEEDGVYSSRVRESVFRYQARYHLWDDTPGEYGPATRRHLEARTSG